MDPALACVKPGLRILRSEIHAWMRMPAPVHLTPLLRGPGFAVRSGPVHPKWRQVCSLIALLLPRTNRDRLNLASLARPGSAVE